MALRAESRLGMLLAISKHNMPKLHRSQLVLCSSPLIISGGIQNGLPHMLFSDPTLVSAHNPKSTVDSSLSVILFFFFFFFFCGGGRKNVFNVAFEVELYFGSFVLTLGLSFGVDEIKALKDLFVIVEREGLRNEKRNNEDVMVKRRKNQTLLAT
jgi:hypothetical protein